ncbi:DHH family phosphoesterase [Agarivorans sp. Alg241-V36]|uniref:DHH family phosphoesterase n=1 Tax=Agarivorans sp. Alg241-V36 TaxID=2305992 RepID=UPI0013D11FB5|nr:DHH family phosphoesterase [Agarivorans sp. Alg241-V36]
MRHIDIFNGDADGIISLIQLRLVEPQDSILLTGVKRENQLMNDFQFQPNDQVTVLDISMEKNQEGLLRALELGATVHYVDHHRPGEIPKHPNLLADINTDADVCTALLIDQKLKGKHHHWAIAGAYGDNLIAKADALCRQAQLSEQQSDQLKELGTLINYNGYGATLADLHYDPAILFKLLLEYTSPFEVIADSQSAYHQLKGAYQEDMYLANSIKPHYLSSSVKVTILPNTAWARRISGVFGNQQANLHPSLAHLVVTETAKDTALVSLRAPLNNKQGAGNICSQYHTGGGREAAAGINQFNIELLNQLISDIEGYYS